ncbi:hypothetical protein D3C77_24630 [compost metagenome]
MNDLPLDYITFAKQMGYPEADQWDRSKGGMKTGWSRIQRQVADSKRIDGLIRDFIGRMRVAQGRLDKARKLQGDGGDSVNMFSLFATLYPQHIPVPAPPSPRRERFVKPVDPAARAAKRKRKKERKNNKPYGTVTIGLGLESTFKPKKIKRDSVVIDSRTRSTSTNEKSIIYAAGWSINGAFDDKL